MPQSLIDSSDSKDKRKVERITRNFAFDRARYYLPMSSMTNVMLLMSARGWVSLIKQLSSEQLTECRQLADRLREELMRVAPRLIRHARFDDSYASGAGHEFQRSMQIARESDPAWLNGPAASRPFLDVMLPGRIDQADLVKAIQYHRGRYDFIGSELQRTSVRFGWQAIPIAEIRDLNRHRTGTKYFTLAPIGTYLADDEVARIEADHPSLKDICEDCEVCAQRASRRLPAAISNWSQAIRRFCIGCPWAFSVFTNIRPRRIIFFTKPSCALAWFALSICGSHGRSAGIMAPAISGDCSLCSGRYSGTRVNPGGCGACS